MMQFMEVIDKKATTYAGTILHQQHNPSFFKTNTTTEDRDIAKLYNSLQLEVKHLTKEIKEIWTDDCKVTLHIVKGGVRALFPATGTGLWSRSLGGEYTETMPRYNTAKDNLVREAL
ncbi:hypothetical protein MAP00_008857 [Monascus purpureus]|nr:hypothetical protein MAP00_008857 [Monascus purpureus]